MSSSEPSDSRQTYPPVHLETTLTPHLENEGDGKLDDQLHGKKAVLIALAANISIGTFKLLAGLVGRHSSMFSEALHSYADAINSGFLLIGLQKGTRAPDKTHPFGYGLETTLWVTLASVFMLLLAGWSIFLGVQRIISPEEFGIYYISAGVLLFSAILEVMAVDVAATAILNEKDIQVEGKLERILLAAKHVKTTVSPTTRFVYYEDSVALLGALVAFAAITISEFGAKVGFIAEEHKHIPDAGASILIGLLLLGLAIYLFLYNSRGLTGTAASPQVESKIREFVLSLNGVSQIHDLKTIDYGISGVVVQLRVEVNPDTMVKDVDDLTERIRERIQERIVNVKEVLIEVLADETNIEWGNQFYRLVEKGRHQHVIKPREEQMLKNVYDFTKSTVRDIMVPRTQVECLEVSQTFDELLKIIADSGHSRIPIYREDVDNMLGTISVKDVMGLILDNKREVFLENLIRPIEIFPENKSVSDLLEDFKRLKIQIAMVADEHGGFAGLVTIEDLLEEIVGEIWEEHAEEFDRIEILAPNKIALSGRYEVDELNERLDLDFPEEEFKTIGGFVFGLVGREPLVGDTVHFEDLTLSVLKMDGRRIDKVQILSPIPFHIKRHPRGEKPEISKNNGGPKAAAEKPKDSSQEK